jgi:hypothetical protein
MCNLCISVQERSRFLVSPEFLIITVIFSLLVGRWSGLASYESFLAKVDQYRLEEGGYRT